jgi:hypothetical protein
MIPMDPSLIEFLAGIDKFNKNNELDGDPLAPESRESDRLTMEELSGLTRDELFNHSNSLYNYVAHVNGHRTKLQNVINYCNDAINRVVGREYENVSKFAPHEVKEAQVAESKARADSNVDGPGMTAS